MAMSGVIALPAQGIYQLWGVRHFGGEDRLGSIYSLDAAGNNFHFRHEIIAENGGAYPKYSALTEYNGKYYGVTSAGGKYDLGVIYEWDPVTNVMVNK